VHADLHLFALDLDLLNLGILKFLCFRWTSGFTRP
jgi:hypothetical protein